MSVYVGIDVHRKRSQVAVVTEDGQVQLNGLAGTGGARSRSGVRLHWGAICLTYAALVVIAAQFRPGEGCPVLLLSLSACPMP